MGIDILSVLAGVAMAALLFKPFFDDFAGFLEALRFWFTPNIVSMFRGEWADDQWASLKLFLYFAICIGVGIAARSALHHGQV